MHPTTLTELHAGLRRSYTELLAGKGSAQYHFTRVKADYGLAMSIVTNARKGTDQNDAFKFMSEASNFMSSLALDHGAPMRAIELSRTSRMHAWDAGDKAGAARSHLREAAALLWSGNPEAADNAAAHGMSVAHGTGDRQLHAQLLAVCCETSGRLGNYPALSQFAAQAEDAQEGLDDRPLAPGVFNVASMRASLASAAADYGSKNAVKMADEALALHPATEVYMVRLATFTKARAMVRTGQITEGLALCADELDISPADQLYTRRAAAVILAVPSGHTSAEFTRACELVRYRSRLR